MSRKAFFPNLSKTRKAKGYTLKEMAMLLDYRSESRYAMYETGDRKPNVIEALRIANVLGETVEFLFASKSDEGEDLAT